MKMSLVLVCSIFFNYVSYSQLDKNFNEIEKKNNEIWVMDSTHIYQYHSYDGLFLKYRQLVMSRNGDGKVTSKLYLKKEIASSDWQKSSRFAQSYYENGKKKEYYLQVFDNYRNIWIDSIQYKKYSEEGLLLYNVEQGWNNSLGKYSYGNRTFKKYNEEGKVISEMLMNWDKESEIWVNKKKAISHYDANGAVLEKIIQIWSEDLQEWVNDDKSTWLYNSSAKITEFTKLKWGNSKWQNSFRKLLTYTDENKTKSVLSQNWNIDNSKWENYVKFLFFYKGGNKIKEINEEWISETDSWFDYRVVEKKYNDEDLLIEDEQKLFYRDSTILNAGSKYVYDYNSKNKVAIKKQFKWNPFNNEWVNYSKRTYTYDSGKTTILSKWDTLAKDFVNISYYQFILNIDGQTILNLSKNWDVERDLWVNVSKTERNYDDFKHLIQMNEFLWIEENELWDLKGRTDYFWSKLTTSGLIDTPVIGCYLFPNPATDHLNISNGYKDFNEARVDVYSMNGNLIISNKIVNNGFLDTSLLDRGVYVLKIKIKDKLISRKIIVGE